MPKAIQAAALARVRRDTARLVKKLSNAPRYAASAAPLRGMAERDVSPLGRRPSCPVCKAEMLRTEISGLSLHPRRISVFYLCEDCSYVSRISVEKG